MTDGIEPRTDDDVDTDSSILTSSVCEGDILSSWKERSVMERGLIKGNFGGEAAEEKLFK